MGGNGMAHGTILPAPGCSTRLRTPARVLPNCCPVYHGAGLLVGLPGGSSLPSRSVPLTPSLVTDRAARSAFGFRAALRGSDQGSGGTVPAANTVGSGEDG